MLGETNEQHPGPALEPAQAAGPRRP